MGQLLESIKVGEKLTHKRKSTGQEVSATRVVGGVEYNGTVYPTLSAAGRQAMKDLGLEAPSCDGGVFWGVKDRAARKAGSAPLPQDPDAMLKAAEEMVKKAADLRAKAAEAKKARTESLRKRVIEIRAEMDELMSELSDAEAELKNAEEAAITE